MTNQEQSREALIRHIADLEAVIRRRNEQIDNQAHNARETQQALEQIARERDEANERAEKHRRAVVDHSTNARCWMQTSEEWQATAEEWEKRARAAEQPRPLTPDAITDEMVERGRSAYWGPTYGSSVAGRVRAILAAALTEPPARPEGAERWEDFLIDSLDYQALTDQQITDLADRIAEEMNR